MSSSPTPLSSYHAPSALPSVQNLVRSQSFDYSSVVVPKTPKPVGSSSLGNSNDTDVHPVTPIPLTLARTSGAGHPLNPDYHFNSSTISSGSFDGINSSSISPFVTLNSTVLRAQYKSNALLPCNVRNSGDGVTVSKQFFGFLFKQLSLFL